MNRLAWLLLAASLAVAAADPAPQPAVVPTPALAVNLPAVPLATPPAKIEMDPNGLPYVSSEEHERLDLLAQQLAAAAASRGANAADEQNQLTRAVIVWTAVGTISTVLATVFLLFTYKLTRDTARAAVGATELARNDFMATHRPRIKLRRVALDLGKKLDGKAVLKLSVVNAGDTPARVMNIKMRTVDLIDPEMDDPEMHDQCSFHPKNWEYWIKAGETLVVETTSSGWFADHVISMSRNGPGIETGTLRVIGDIVYVDKLETIRTTGFDRIADARSRLFKPTVDSQDEFAD
jgi:hypothetical protein